VLTPNKYSNSIETIEGLKVIITYWIGIGMKIAVGYIKVMGLKT
jgi:hypothetical protein